MSVPRLRLQYRRELAAELHEAEEARHWEPPAREDDFDRAKAAKLARMENGSPEAKALEALTWFEVADDLYTRYERRRGLDLRRNLVSVSHAANVAGVNDGDFSDVLGQLGFKTMNGTLDRKDVRAILTKLLIREEDPDTKDRIRTAIHVFADEPEEDERK